MWEFYLATSEAAFRHDRLFVFQLQLARHQDAVPVRRGYLAAAEAELRSQEAAPSASATKPGIAHDLAVRGLGVEDAPGGDGAHDGGR